MAISKYKPNFRRLASASKDKIKSKSKPKSKSKSKSIKVKGRVLRIGQIWQYKDVVGSKTYYEIVNFDTKFVYIKNTKRNSSTLQYFLPNLIVDESWTFFSSPHAKKEKTLSKKSAKKLIQEVLL